MAPGSPRDFLSFMEICRGEGGGKENWQAIEGRVKARRIRNYSFPGINENLHFLPYQWCRRWIVCCPYPGGILSHLQSLPQVLALLGSHLSTSFPAPETPANKKDSCTFATAGETSLLDFWVKFMWKRGKYTGFSSSRQAFFSLKGEYLRQEEMCRAEDRRIKTKYLDSLCSLKHETRWSESVYIEHLSSPDNFSTRIRLEKPFPFLEWHETLSRLKESS